MHNINTQKLTAALAAAFLLLVASPMVSESQAAPEHALLPIAQVTDRAVSYDDDRGFPWGLLGLAGLIGLLGRKGKEHDHKVHDTTREPIRPRA